MTQVARLSAIRIAKVNHAGEYGAIRIYGAQIAVCRRFWPKLADRLSELKAHEVIHCQLFASALAERGGRPCRAMYLWSMGGWLLGAISALFGPNQVWACTEASAWGAIIAAVAPCKMRPIISTHGDQAKPHNNDAAAKPISPRKNILPRP